MERRDARRIDGPVGLLQTLLGLWLAATPFVYEVSGAGQWHLYVWGVGLAIMGAYQGVRGSRRAVPVAGVGLVFLLVGVWVALSSFVYTYKPITTWNLVMTGVLLSASGALQVAHARRTPEGVP